jgi:SAM-dependent methyltransferase
MTDDRRGIPPKAVFLPAALVLVAGLFLFHHHRAEGFDAEEFPLPVMYYVYAHQPDSSAGQAGEPDRPPGLWFPARDGGDAPDSIDRGRREEIEELRSLGYLAGYHDAPVEEGVTVFDRERAFPGYNLMVSGHAPGAVLLDMEGEPVHEWYVHFDQLRTWPGSEDVDMNLQFWTRVMLLPGGDLLALIENLGMARLSRESDVEWVSGYIEPHHDFDVGPDDSIYVICKEVHIDEDYNPDRPILDEVIRVLDPGGNVVRSIHVRDALAGSPYAPVLRRMPPEGDILHANTVEYIQGDFSDSIAPLREGTLLLSLRTIDLVCALDMEAESVYWAESDLWFKQHQPTMLEDGNMLVFDNRGFRQDSRVLVIDPASREVVWSYRGEGDDTFFSVGRGSNQRLPNGNTLITESNQGRAFEVTPEGEIVWEYVSPYRAGDHRELIATLFEMVRYPPDMVEGWLDR